MNNKIISILMVLALLAPWPSDAAEKKDKSSVIEADDAIFGRIFGVQGAGADIQHHVFELSDRTPGHAAVRSAFVPGWGQKFNDESVKGALFFTATIAAAYGSVSRYKESRTSYHNYQQDGLKNSSKFDDYRTEESQAYVLGGVALLLYGFGIYDAYHGSYRKLYSRKTSVDVAMDLDSQRVVWSRKF